MGMWVPRGCACVMYVLAINRAVAEGFRNGHGGN